MLHEVKACLNDAKQSNAALAEKLSTEVAEARAEANRLQAEKEVASEKASQEERKRKDLEITLQVLFFSK